MKGDNIEDIKAKQEDLQKKFYAASEKMYKAAAEEAQKKQAAEGANPAGGAQNADGNVYEADFKDASDEDKK